MIVKWRHNVAIIETSLTFHSNFLCLCETAPVYVPLSLPCIWFVLLLFFEVFMWWNQRALGPAACLILGGKECHYSLDIIERTHLSFIKSLVVSRSYWCLLQYVLSAWNPVQLPYSKKMQWSLVHFLSPKVGCFFLHLWIKECKYLLTLCGCVFSECSSAYRSQIPACELKWPLLSEPPRYKTLTLLKSDRRHHRHHRNTVLTTCLPRGQ